MIVVAGAGVLLTALGLLGITGLVALRPERAKRFLESFASSLRAHLTEQAIRIAAGSALIVYSPQMRLPEVWHGFGWLLVGTSALLMLIPWRWHRRFAQRVIPRGVLTVRLYGLGTLVLGSCILYGVFRP